MGSTLSRSRGRSASLLQRTIEALGRAIVTGDLVPGIVLPVEDALAVRFGVGRNLVREAVKILGEKGLLRTERRSGTIVLDALEWDYLDHDVMEWTLENPAARDRLVDELAALRVIIEPEVAAIAARHATATETLRLFEALERMEASIGDEALVVEADISFHRRLFEATHNRLLLSLVRTVTAVLKSNFALSIKVKQDVPQYHLAEHRLVAEAVRQGDSARARALMRDLLEHNAHHLTVMRGLERDWRRAEAASKEAPFEEAGPARVAPRPPGVCND